MEFKALNPGYHAFPYRNDEHVDRDIGLAILKVVKALYQLKVVLSIASRMGLILALKISQALTRGASWCSPQCLL